MRPKPNPGGAKSPSRGRATGARRDQPRRAGFKFEKEKENVMSFANVVLYIALIAYVLYGKARGVADESTKKALRAADHHRCNRLG